MRLGWRAAGWLAVAAALAGCNFAPDYHPPKTVVPEAYKGASTGQEWRGVRPADTIDRGSWWTMFGDADLDALEAKVEGADQNLRAAAARYDQARAASATARALYYPAVTVNADPTRQQLSRTIANPRPNTLYNDFLFDLDISYEIDLWGRVRNLVANAESTEQASAADLATIDLSIHAELATDYYTLRGQDTDQAILDRNVQAFQQAYELTARRHAGGAVAESDLDQAQAQLEAARSQAADNRLRRSQLEHAIAILIGVPPAQFALPAKPLGAISLPAIDPGLPSSLLERRPDVAAAERRANAANASIGVAEAAFYPDFNLSLAGGIESAAGSQLLSTASRIWSLGLAGTTPLFDGGQRSSLTDQAIAAFDEAAANYRQTVLVAFREVEDNLVALRELEAESRSQALAVDAADRAVRQAQLRYTGGLTTYLEVTTTQNTALQDELSAADIAARRLTAAVALVQALGGGWRTSDIPPPHSGGFPLSP